MAPQRFSIHRFHSNIPY